MKSKATRIVLDVVLSIVVFAVVLVIESLVAQKIFGTHKVADGSDKINGGGAMGVALFAIGGAVTIFFAVQFYKFLTSYKIAKVNEVKNVGE